MPVFLKSRDIHLSKRPLPRDFEGLKFLPKQLVLQRVVENGRMMLTKSMVRIRNSITLGNGSSIHKWIA